MASKKTNPANEAPAKAAAPKPSRRRSARSAGKPSAQGPEDSAPTTGATEPRRDSRRHTAPAASNAGAADPNAVTWGPIRVEREIGGRMLTLETGRMAKLADGAVVARYGDTMVLATAQSAKAREDMDFLPLTVEYREKPAAAGKFPGGFFKREGRPTTKEILACRIIDRSIRPLFPEGFRAEIQVLSQVLSTDQQNDSDIVAAIASFAAIAISSIPHNATLGLCRIGLKNDKLIVNPDWQTVQSKENLLNLTVAAHKDAVVMVEAGAQQVAEEVMLEAIDLARKVSVEVAALIDELVALAGKPKATFVPPVRNEALAKEIDRKVGKQLRAAPVTPGPKAARRAAKEEALGLVAEHFPPAPDASEKEAKDHKKFVSQVAQELMDQGERLSILEGRRADGRDWTTIRPITIEVGVLPRVHGSVLFTRGETQALVIATLGTSDDEQNIDGIYPESPRRFLLHYNFPPFSVGEVKRVGSVGRREIGHGALAERAIESVLPPPDVFPYTLRLTSEILESNGSSSMATVCGGILALMDAGVPLQQPVAGVAMGLVIEGKRYAILSDILGSEDHCGDMDFKVAGTGKGITALQMDIKCDGLTREILVEALEQARLGRLHVLREMLKAMRKPREVISPNAPRLVAIKIPVDKIGLVIGPSGKMIRGMQEEFATKIHIEDDGTVTVAGLNMEKVEACVNKIKAMTAEVEVGTVYKGRVSAIKEFGAFVEILPGQEGLCHVSELSDEFIRAVTDVVRIGDEVEVKVIAIDDFGKIKLSRKALLEGGAGRPSGSDRPHREREPASPRSAVREEGAVDPVVDEGEVLLDTAEGGPDSFRPGGGDRGGPREGGFRGPRDRDRGGPRHGGPGAGRGGHGGRPRGGDRY